MVGFPRESFCNLFLRPITHITTRCRRNNECNVSPKGIANPISELQKPPHNASVPSGDKLCANTGSDHEASNQLQCPLLSKLPTEVRMIIYHNVLCEPVPVVHIVRRKDGSLCHVRCRASRGECGTYRCYNDYSELSRSTKAGKVGPSTTISGGLLALPLTCKKMLVFCPHCTLC